MTLAIRTLIKIFPLHTKTQGCHLKYSLCYSKYQNVGIFSCEEVTYVDEWNHIGD